jgi:hypothetical protein
MRLEESDKGNSSSSTSSDEDDISNKMRTKRPATAARSEHSVFPAQQNGQHEAEVKGSEDELLSSTSKKSSPLKRLRRGTKDTPNIRRTRRNARQDDDEESDDEVTPSSRKRRTSLVDVDFAESESSGDNAPALYSSPTRKRKTSATKFYKEDDFVVLSDNDSNDAFVVDDVPSKSRAKKNTGRSSHHRRAQPVSEDEDEDEEEEEEAEVPVRKRRLKRGARKLTDREQVELDDDLEFLQSSPPGAKSNLNPKKANPRMEALEALKRKRAGLDDLGFSVAQTSGNGRQRYSRDTSEEEEVGEEVNEEYQDTAIARRRGAFDWEEDVNDFIIDDDEDEPLGAPNLDVEMPLWATGFMRMKAKELFRYAVEWMVQKKLNPAYDQEREKYDIAFQKLNDEVQGLAGSKFRSAAWTRDFTISLQARPRIELLEIHKLRTDLELDKCQACNRSGHPATFEIQFRGRPYHPRTLEPIEQDYDNDSDASEHSSSSTSRDEYDHKGRLVPSASRTYSVGRFCKDNAMTAHALEHWKFQLNEWVVDWLEGEGHLTNEKIVRRDRWDEPRRRKYARKVVEEMDEVGQVKRLYRQFRDEIDSAREMKVSHFVVYLEIRGRTNLWFRLDGGGCRKGSFKNFRIGWKPGVMRTL